MLKNLRLCMCALVVLVHLATGLAAASPQENSRAYLRELESGDVDVSASLQRATHLIQVLDDWHGRMDRNQEDTTCQAVLVNLARACSPGR